MRKTRRITRMAAAVIGRRDWKDVSAPVGWTWSLPFTIEQKVRTFRIKAGWTIDGAKPTGKAYYVSTTGNDTNDGLTLETAMRTIYKAFDKVDIDICYVAAGAYGLTYGWGTQDSHRSVSVIPIGGRVSVGPFADPLTWTADGASYKATRSHVLKVADTTQIDTYGDYSFLALVVDAATCKTTPGSWYTDATTVWVHTIDSRLPTVSVRCFFDNSDRAGTTVTGNTTIYVENVDFEGGITSCFQVGNAANPITASFNNCTFKYATMNGLASVGSATTYCKNCIAAKNGLDGFNYHKGSGTIPYFVEINCIGRDNGTAGDTIDNGSTCHDGAQGVRIMGEYMRSVGRPVHDITTGTQSWNLGCYSHDSNAAPQLANWGCGTGAGDSCVMWLDCCRSSGSGEDIEVVVGCTVNVRGFVGAAVNAGAGTVESY